MSTVLNISKSAEYLFLNNLFSSLNQANIQYSVLRNYETLPYSTSGSDLDILIDSRDSKLAKEILSRAIEQAGGVTLGYIKTVGWFSVFAIGCVKNEKGGWWGVVIDVFCSSVFLNGASPLLEFEWNNRRIHNGVFVVPDDIAAVLGVLKEVLYNNRVPDRYVEQARSAVHSNWETIAASLRPIGNEALSLFQQLLSDPSTEVISVSRCIAIRKQLCRHAMRREPLSYFSRRLCFEWSKVRRYLQPTGVVFAILGVDGAGKSTVIDVIKPVLDAATHRAVFVQHLCPGLLPPLARLKGKVEISMGPVLDPHGSTPSGVLGSLLRLSYLTLDYVLGYWFKTRFKIAKQPAVILYDRYAYDMALDPRRIRIGLPGWVGGLFARLAPRPDLILCLHADPEVIAARKRELPLEETRRQVEALRAFAKTQPNAVLISTEGTIEEVRERVLGTLFDFFAKRATHGCPSNPPDA